jgi:hypothetical protein
VLRLLDQPEQSGDGRVWSSGGALIHAPKAKRANLPRGEASPARSRGAFLWGDSAAVSCARLRTNAHAMLFEHQGLRPLRRAHKSAQLSAWRALSCPQPERASRPPLILLSAGLFASRLQRNKPRWSVVDCWARRVLAPLRSAPIAPRSSEPPLARGFSIRGSSENIGGISRSERLRLLTGYRGWRNGSKSYRPSLAGRGGEGLPALEQRPADHLSLAAEQPMDARLPPRPDRHIDRTGDTSRQARAPLGRERQAHFKILV